MQAFIIILLSLGFTAGIVISSVKSEQLSVDKTSSADKTEVVHIESDLDSIEDNTRDSIFPLL